MLFLYCYRDPELRICMYIQPKVKYISSHFLHRKVTNNIFRLYLFSNLHPATSSCTSFLAHRSSHFTPYHDLSSPKLYITTACHLNGTFKHCKRQLMYVTDFLSSLLLRGPSITYNTVLIVGYKALYSRTITFYCIISRRNWSALAADSVYCLYNWNSKKGIKGVNTVLWLLYTTNF